MATVALAAAGSAAGSAALPGLAGALITGGTIGASIGGLAGGVLDNILFAKLFGRDEPVSGSQFDEIRLQGAAEGSPATWTFGEQNRVGAKIIWTSEIKRRSRKVGGGGIFGGDSQTVYEHFIDVAFEVSHHKVSHVQQIFANGKIIFDKDQFDLDGTEDSRYSAIRIYDGTQQIHPSVGPQIPDPAIEASEGAGNVPAYLGRAIVVIEDLALAEFGSLPNLEAIVAESVALELGPMVGKILERLGGLTSSQYDVSSLPATVVPGLAISGIQPAIPSIEALMLAYNLGARERDGVLEFFKRDGQTPVSLDQGVMVSSGAVTFSSRTDARPGVPTEGQTTNAIWRPSATWDVVPQVGSKIYVSGSTSNNGVYTVSAAGSAFVHVEEELTDEVAGSGVTITAMIADLGADDADSNSAPILDIEDDSSSEDIPSEVLVRYSDTDRDLLDGERRVSRQNAFGGVPTAIDLPLSMSVDQATAIGERLLWSAEAERATVTTQLSPGRLAVQTGDLVSFTREGRAQTVRISELTRGANFVHEVRSHFEDQSVFVSVFPSEGTEIDREGPNDLPALVLFAIDASAVWPEQAEGAALFRGYVYMAVAASNPTLVYPGAGVFWTRSGLVHLNRFMPLSLADGVDEAVIGTALTTLDPYTGGGVDYERTVDVELMNGTLESATDEEFIAGANMAFLGSEADGWEVIQFKTATFLGTSGGKNQYRLSNLLRGLRGTEYLIDSRATGHRFALVDTALRAVLVTTQYQIGQEQDYLPVANGLAVADAPTAPKETIVFNAYSAYPWQVAHVTGVRNGANDLTISFVARDRGFGPMFGEDGPGQIEPFQRFIIEILTGPGGTVLSQFVLEDVTEYTYTAAQQTSDGLTPGDPVTARIFQIGQAVRRGHQPEFTL